MEVTQEHQEHRTCSAAGPGQDAPQHGAANSRREEAVLAAARLQVPAASLSLLGTTGRNSLGTAKGPLGAQVALGPFKNHRCTK